MKHGSLWKKASYFLMGILFLILLWWLLNIFFENQNLHYLPSPWTIFGNMGRDLFGANAKAVYPAIGYSVLKLLIGFSISFLFAAVIGILGALFEPFGLFMRGHVLLMQSLPTVGVAMILGTAFWLEARAFQPYIPSILVFLVAFPILEESFIRGILSLGEDQKDAIRLEGALRKPWTVWAIYLPNAAPYIGLGAANAFGLSFKVTIMSEIVTNASSSKAIGLGTLIGKAIQQNADLNEAISLSLIVVLLVFIVDGIKSFTFYFAKKRDE